MSFSECGLEIFDKRSKGVLRSDIENKHFPGELHKPIIKKLKRGKVYFSFEDNIWCVDLADMQLIKKLNEGINYLFCVIDGFSKYNWVVPLKNKKCCSIVYAFQKILNKSKTKPNKMWVDHGSEFYNNVFKNF